MNLNPTEMGAVSATITDQNNNAVSNAFIRGLNLYKIKYHDPGPFDDELVKNWIYTFSDDTGYFKLIPYTENLINDYRIFIVSGSATGTEKFAYGNNETQVTIPSSIIIDRVKFEFDDIFNEIVPFGVDKNFKAWNSIKINSEILGQSTIRAREEINLTNGFHAFTNSEVHIFPDQTFGECDDYQNFSVVQRMSGATLETNNSNVKNIELSFRSNEIKNFDFYITPNPASNYTTLKLSNIDIGTVKIINLRDQTGRLLYTRKFNNNELNLDLNKFLSGIYTIEIISQEQKIVKKIVVI